MGGGLNVNFQWDTWYTPGSSTAGAYAMKRHRNSSFNDINIHNQKEKMQSLPCLGSNVEKDIAPCALIVSQPMLVTCIIQIGDM